MPDRSAKPRKRYLAASVLCGLLALAVLAPPPSEAESPVSSGPSQQPRPTIVVGGDSNFPPGTFIEDGRPTGFVLDVIRAVAAGVGHDVEFRLSPWKKTLADLKAGQVDVVAMSYSRKREEDFDFSVQFAVNAFGLMVRKNAGIESIADIHGKNVLVQDGGVMRDYINNSEIIANITYKRDAGEIIKLLSNGEYDGAFFSKKTALYLAKTLGITNIEFTDENISPRRTAFGVREGNYELVQMLNEGLSIVNATGELKEINEKWFGPATAEDVIDFAMVRTWAIRIGLAVLVFLAAAVAWNRRLAREVKERKRIEEALRTSEVRHREAQRRANIGHWEWNLEDGTHWRSEEYARILGRSADDLFTDFETAIENVVHPVDRAMVLRRREELIGDGKSYDIDFRIVRPDGAIRHVHSAAEVQRDADGTPIRMRGVTQDITERKQAEEALRESEATNRVLFETMAQGVVFQDADGNIISANPAAETILGITFEQMTGRTSMDPRWRAIREDGSPFSGEAHPSMIALKTGEKVNDVVMGVFNPGMNEIRWININAVPRFRPGWEAPYQVYATFDDITERERAAEALRNAKEEAELASHAKTVFLASMSHELRTPLNSIIGFAQMLGSEVFGPLGSDKYREYAGDIGKSGTHLLNVIKDLLDVSKIEAGATELVEEEVDIYETIGSCAVMVQERAANGGVELVNEVPSGLPALFVDPTQLKQIFLNLLINAIKFTAVDGRVTVAADIGEDRCLAVTVTDTGIGIAAEDIPRVLEPFGQVGDVMTRSHDGTGLGLPLAKSMVELHGGTFDLQSQVGVGTTVTVRFPAARVIGG